MSDDAEVLKQEIKFEERLRGERNISDTRYAIKWVERIVFGLIGLIVITVFGGLLKLIIK